MTPGPGLRWVDLVDEVVAGVVQRPVRALLTSLGTALAVGAFVAVLGLTATASGQISERFTALGATEVVLERMNADGSESAAFPDDGVRRVRELPGVRHAGVVWRVPLGGDRVSSRPVEEQDEGGGDGLPVLAAGDDYLAAIHARTSTGGGVLLDAFHQDRGERVAVIGKAAAHRLGIARLDAQPAVFIGGTAFTVIGVVDGVDRAQETLLSVVIPARTAERLWGPVPASGDTTKLLVDTELGAAQQVGRQAKVAARPDSVERTRAIVPPDPRSLRDAVETDMDLLFLGLAGVSLVVGGVGIANTSLVAVMERVPEIGLRRALGGGRRQIAGQFLLESGLLGLLGGLVGAAAGVLAVLLVAVIGEQTPIIEPHVVYPAPLIGLVTGLFAGLYPAWRASRIEPAEALRR